MPSPLGTRLPPWQAEPCRLWSLLDMIEFVGTAFVSMVASLQSDAGILMSDVVQDGGAGPLPPNAISRLSGTLDSAEAECHRINLLGSLTAIRSARRYLVGPEKLRTHQALFVAFQGVLALINDELGKQKFVYVPPEKHEFFEAVELFGPHVTAAFGPATGDIREAGNCLAVGANTAAVFHLMRAAEWGLRKVARSVGVKPFGKPGKKQTPVAFATWGQISDGITAKIDALHKANPSPLRARRLTHYSEMNSHILAFKDAWRNDIMHSREQYDEHQARSILIHIRGFMQRVASGPPK
jgi:hypothetical protein